MARFVIEVPDDQVAAVPQKGRFVIEQAPKAPDPTEDMSGFQKVAAGVGKAMYDVARGAGQMVGLVDRKDIEESRKLDAALMRTTEGKIGNLAGSVATMLPAAVIPGANTLAGATAIGAVSGLLQPSTSTAETLTNTAVGGVLAPVANIAGRAIGAGAQGVKALVEPFYAKGQDKIAARVLQTFADDPAKAAAAAAAAKMTPTGAQLPLAEATKDVGLAQLQRALQSTDPTGFATELANRQMSNNAARVAALRQIAGDDVALAGATDARDAAAQALYGKAFSSDAMRRDLAQTQAVEQAMLVPGRGVSIEKMAADAIKPSPVLQDLGKRQAFQSAMKEAKVLAKNKGEEIGDPLSSLRGLHYIKLALDDMLEPSATNSLARNGKSAVTDMKGTLLQEMERLSPTYGTAKEVFQEMSVPINQMQVGQRLLNQFTSATNDLSGNPKLRSEAFNKALRNEEQLLKQATGFKGKQGLDAVMSPEQVQTLRAIADEIGTIGAVEAAARASGSPTAQNLASQNVLRQFLGPTGLPQSWAESTMLETLMRPVQFAAKAGEPKITNRLAAAMLNPEEAAVLLQMVNNPTVLQQFGRRALPYVAPAALGVQRAEALRD